MRFTSIGRRDFLALSLGMAVGVAASPRRALARLVEGEYFDWKSIAGGTWVAHGEGGNVLLLVGQGEAIVVDAKNCGFGGALRREAELLGAPVRTLINTHHHGDHTGGNHAFAGDAKMIAHANLVPRIPANIERYRGSAANAIRQLDSSTKPGAAEIAREAEALVEDFPDAKAFAPGTPLDIQPGSPEERTIAGADVELHYFGPGHTDNDVVVLLPKLNIIHCGDLLFNKWWPYIDPLGGGNTAGWLACVEAILPLVNDKTIVVPGHGEVGDRSAIQRQIDFFRDMRARAAKAVADGTSREDFLKLDPSEYKAYEPRIRQITLGGLYDEAKRK